MPAKDTLNASVLRPFPAVDESRVDALLAREGDTKGGALLRSVKITGGATTLCEAVEVLTGI